MADSRKQIWKFQEGAVALALEESFGSDVVHWGDTPDGMSIDPDVVVGEQVDAPAAVVFVTHATAERAGEKKFWRTVAEVVEAKRLGTKPRVVSVLFASNVKNNLLIAYRELFDAVFHLDDSSWGEEFSDALKKLANRHGGKPKETCLLVLKDKVDQKKVPGWAKFASALSKCLKGKHGKYHKRIASSSFKASSGVPPARETSLRRSMCKYYTFPPPLREGLRDSKRIKDAPEHAVLLGWLNKGIAGYRLSDPEMSAFLKASEPSLRAAIVDHIDKKIPVFQQYVVLLRDTAGRAATYDWLLDHHKELTEPKKLFVWLRRVFEDPAGPLKDAIPRTQSPDDHWLFNSIMILLRTETGRKDGYGYARLSEECGLVKGITGGYIDVSDYSNRKSDLADDVLLAIAKTFSAHLLRLGVDRCRELLGDSLNSYVASNFNYKLINYRNYNPVDWLVCDRLSDSGISFEFPAVHASFLSEHGGGLATSTGNLIAIDGGQVWIKCQSTYAGRIDKRKELCGRVGAMKLCYTPSELEQKKFFLVLDGFFDDNDLALLDQAGWDGIFYYDELDDLVAAITEEK